MKQLCIPVAFLLALFSITAESAQAEPLTIELELLGISFVIQSTNDSSINSLIIQPAGLELDNRPINLEVDGTVTGAEVADLNSDGSPEIYVYITSAGSGSCGSVVAYAANRKKSLSDIYIPDLHQDKSGRQGYMGHDEFRIDGNTLLRRFPIYKQNDTNHSPSGDFREIYYELTAGEAGWHLSPLNNE